MRRSRGWWCRTTTRWTTTTPTPRRRMTTIRRRFSFDGQMPIGRITNTCRCVWGLFPIGARMRLYRGLTFGTLVQFNALDTRQYRSRSALRRRPQVSVRRRVQSVQHDDRCGAGGMVAHPSRPIDSEMECHRAADDVREVRFPSGRAAIAPHGPVGWVLLRSPAASQIFWRSAGPRIPS